ncbi:hypothetical protein [Glutamicibacter creatinolyticus]|uniref:hypothetical protein n=1 Tax=Glutamicibacter creatinolyticus TaxID=162496 RepID=UPI003216E644
MSFGRKLTALGVSLGLLVGGTMATAAPAQAGQSIGKTWNGGVKVWYTYYASTNTFCLQRGSTSPSNVGVRFYNSSGSHLGSLSVSGSTKIRHCVDLKGVFKVREDAKIKFQLYNSKGSKSNGRLTV